MLVLFMLVFMLSFRYPPVSPVATLNELRFPMSEDSYLGETSCRNFFLIGLLVSDTSFMLFLAGCLFMSF